MIVGTVRSTVPTPPSDLPAGPLRVIVDSRRLGMSARGHVSKIQECLRRQGLEHTIATANGERDAGQRARDLLAAGGRFLVAAGDDTTVSAVVNAIVRSGPDVARETVFGVLPAGRDCDFTKTFGLPDDLERAAHHLSGQGLYPIDVGKLTFADPAGSVRTTYFANLAQAGFGAAVAARAERFRRVLGRAEYFAAFWVTMALYRRPEVHVRAGSKEFAGKATSVVVGNCQFSRGARISPRSFPGDGLLDVLVYRGPKSDAFTKLPKMFHGEQVPDENIAEYRAKNIELDADIRLPVEADGTVVGYTPATFELIPHAVRLKI